MRKGRLEAFSDGVLAIIITIMVLGILPFATDWIGESDIEEAPVMLYSCVLLLSMLSYKLLEYLIVKSEGKTSAVGTNLKKDTKGLILIVINFLAILTAFSQPVIAMLILLIMAIYWIIPSKRLEKAYNNINN